uniref:C-type lectin domain-containing protein n=1 Tax=Pinctada fucata TaxID=50426 RepID=A0A194AJ77_PINFU
MLNKITFFVVCIALVNADCGNGWTRYQDSCYLFSRFVGSYSEAEFFCTSVGGNLVQLETAAENNFVKQKLQELHPHDPNIDSANYWIGLHDVLVEGEYRWMPSELMLSNSDWIKGEPNNADHGIEDEDCVEMNGHNGFKWNDNDCSTRLLFICEALNVNDGQIQPGILG